MSKRFIVIVVAVLAFMAIALPAFAQEEGGTGEAVVNVAGTTLFLSLIISYFVEWVRSRWAGLDGDIIRLFSIAVGIAAAVGFDLNTAADLGFADMPKVLSYIATGLAIAQVSGFLGTGKNALRARDPKSSINSEPE